MSALTKSALLPNARVTATEMQPGISVETSAGDGVYVFTNLRPWFISDSRGSCPVPDAGSQTHRLRESADLEFRAEFFNLTNTPAFA